MIIEKSKSVFSKKCEEYFVLHNIDHHATFMFHNDVKVVWQALTPKMTLDDLHKYLLDSGYDMQLEDLSEFITLFASLGVVKVDGIDEDLDVINENNQYDTFIDYCCERNQPTILHIELTNNCNLRCIHCFHDDIHNQLKYEDIARLLRSVKDTSFVRVTITGGEIGLYPYWKEIVKEAKANGLSVAILSNLTCFSGEDLDYIASCNPLFVRTSIYGASSQIHDSITGIQKSFEKTLNAIKHLQSKGVKALAACSVMKQNADEIIALKAMMGELNIPIEFGYQILPSRLDSKQVEELMISGPQFKRLMGAGVLKKQTEASCNPGSFRIAIDQVGNIYSCDALRIPIGNIKDNTVFEALQSNEMKKIREELKNYHPDKCINCAESQKCFKCPGLIWSYHPYVNECSKVHCIYTKVSSCKE